MIHRRAWLKSLLAAGAAGVVSVGVTGVPSARAGQAVGKPAADFTLADLGGQKVALQSLRGKVVVLDFWASWCDPCMRELPELEKLRQELAGKDVAIVALNIDTERKNALAVVNRFKLGMTVLFDPEGKTAERYDPPKMPSTFVIDKAGVVRHLNAGFDGKADIEKLKKQIATLLA